VPAHWVCWGVITCRGCLSRYITTLVPLLHVLTASCSRTADIHAPCAQRQLGAYLGGRPFLGSHRDKLAGATGRTEPHYYAEPGAALALRDTSGRSHGRWSPGHDRAWSSQRADWGVYAACLMAFNELLAPALKRVRLQFVQYFFYRLVSLEHEKQSRMACVVRFGLFLSQHVRTRFESIRICDCAVKLQCAFRPPKKVRTRQHK
jgi:hypothetical protein